jgi:hypothetical protein
MSVSLTPEDRAGFLKEETKKTDSVAAVYSLTATF